MPADDAYKQAKYEVADSLYQQALLQKPDDPDLNAALVRTELREGRLADATTRANRMVADAPQAAPALTALAEVQLRQGATVACLPDTRRCNCWRSLLRPSTLDPRPYLSH